MSFHVEHFPNPFSMSDDSKESSIFQATKSNTRNCASSLLYLIL